MVLTVLIRIYGDKMNRRGYYSIGVYKPKTESNIGTLLRTACIFNASYVFTIGRRYKKQASDTMKTPFHIPLFHYSTFEDFYNHLPWSCQLVAIEISTFATMLKDFEHPKMCSYLLGAEDGGIPMGVLGRCHKIVQLGGRECLNVATAGSIVIYNRVMLR